MIDLQPEYLAEVERILELHAPGCQVRAFGSRVTGRAARYSDLDLVLNCGEPLHRRRIEALRDAFSDSDLPFQVDVVDWQTVSAAFRQAIERACVVLEDVSQPGPVGPTRD